MGDTIGVGVIGLGFMGATHIRAYDAAIRSGEPCTLAAVCDQDEGRLSGAAGGSGNMASGEAGTLFDPSRVATYTRVEELLADERVDLVSICTHTDSHVETAIAALKAGKHVIVEKPVAVLAADIARLGEVAAASDRLCMPAMCIRFWPAWACLKEAIDDGRFGAVRSATFHRLGSSPNWSPGFYADASRSGGALVDLHIHDADFVTHCFGPPVAVSSVGSIYHMTTSYRFENGPLHVVAEGAWDNVPAFGFRMRFVVCFERATVDFDLGRENELMLYRDGGEGGESIEVGAASGYDGEIVAMLGAIRSGRDSPPATVGEALFVSRLLEAERRSIETGETVRV
jgi:predicted dehydrogenase